MLATITKHPFRYLLYNVLLAAMFFGCAEFIIALKIVLVERSPNGLITGLVNAFYGAMPFFIALPLGLSAVAVLLLLARFGGFRENVALSWLVVILAVLTTAAGGLLWSFTAATSPDGDFSGYSIPIALFAAWLSVALSFGASHISWTKSSWKW